MSAECAVRARAPRRGCSSRTGPVPGHREAQRGLRAAHGSSVENDLIAAAGIGLGSRLTARRGRRLRVYVLATPVFVVVLFTFYEHVARLLPANV